MHALTKIIPFDHFRYHRRHCNLRRLRQLCNYCRHPNRRPRHNRRPPTIFRLFSNYLCLNRHAPLS